MPDSLTVEQVQGELLAVTDLHRAAQARLDALIESLPPVEDPELEDSMLEGQVPWSLGYYLRSALEGRHSNAAPVVDLQELRALERVASATEEGLQADFASTAAGRRGCR